MKPASPTTPPRGACGPWRDPRAGNASEAIRWLARRRKRHAARGAGSLPGGARCR